jgi:enoyl-CoA hydratase/carnithine racemase
MTHSGPGSNPGTILVDDHDRVRRVTFHRPEAKNAFDLPMWQGAHEALHTACNDDAIGAVVLTGSGEAYTAGADVKAMGDPEQRAASKVAFDAFLATLESFPKPLLAAVNGVAIGIGLTMLAHCDLVFVSRTARLRAPFASLGVAPEAGSSVALPLRIGWQHTANLFFTSAWLDAQGALDCGLAWKICEPESLLEETMAEAYHIAAMPVASLVATKQLMLAGRLDAVRAARSREGEMFRRLLEARN